ncbi:HoxN/HupN/NixA family nickel/cobalt transporter [Secundilactobacillus collinoides]|uniref:HoxN/HupN/NixA family nickel/cobalt transporter n=1 Tax=Secundilactobacillus collinoides TaxID=33960 RepID=UPI0006CFF831|nr:hypothetical protein [Secundilactobacillus collinoides]
MIRKQSVFGYYLVIVGLHLLGLSLIVFTHSTTLLGTGLLAYTLGLRHAFDADHISAIDNTVRKLTQEHRRAKAVGFYFSLGHSTIVFVMATLVIFSVSWLNQHLSNFQSFGSVLGTGISGTFLLLIAGINGIMLFKLIHQPTDNHSVWGPMFSLFKSRFALITREWQLYPVGLLFGLGFDTASEISLLAMTAQSTQQHLSSLTLIAFPILFTAGMNLMDTTDSVMMSSAYRWAFGTPLRKRYYNITVTLISVIIALFIGSFELLKLIAQAFKFKNGVWHFIEVLQINWLGFGLVFLLGVVWCGCFIWQKLHSLTNELN